MKCLKVLVIVSCFFFVFSAACSFEKKGAVEEVTPVTQPVETPAKTPAEEPNEEEPLQEDVPSEIVPAEPI